MDLLFIHHLIIVIILKTMKAIPLYPEVVAIERLPFRFSVCERGTGREVANLSFLIINERRGARLLPT